MRWGGPSLTDSGCLALAAPRLALAASQTWLSPDYSVVIPWLRPWLLGCSLAAPWLRPWLLSGCVFWGVRRP